MAAPDGQADEETEPASPDRCVSALRASPDRTVFTEEGNSDGWIATDYTVEPRR